MGFEKNMIGIVILNFENWKDTKYCVKSIHANPPQDAYRILLVDNASKKRPDFDLHRFILQYQLLYIQNTENLGYNGGNNQGIAKALEIGCDVILISNNDVRFYPESIQNMCDYFKSHPQTGIVGPKILDVHGHVQKSNLCRKTGLKEKYLVRTRANVIFRRSWRTYFGYDRDYDQSFEVYAVLGCCFMMSALCARKVTPLDAYPLLYEEELILGIQMEQAGLRTVYDPKAVIVHLHGASTKRLGAFSFAHNVRSEIYYCRAYLHASKLQIYPLYFYRVLLYLFRCIRSADFRRGWRFFCRLTGQELDKVQRKKILRAYRTGAVQDTEEKRQERKRK